MRVEADSSRSKIKTMETFFLQFGKVSVVVDRTRNSRALLDTECWVVGVLAAPLPLLGEHFVCNEKKNNANQKLPHLNRRQKIHSRKFNVSTSVAFCKVSQCLACKELESWSVQSGAKTLQSRCASVFAIVRAGSFVRLIFSYCKQQQQKNAIKRNECTFYGVYAMWKKCDKTAIFRHHFE